MRGYSAGIVTAILISSGLIAGCAQTPVERQVDREASQQPARSMHGEVALKGIESIESSTSLTEDQKKRFRQLHLKMTADTFAIQEETSRLKGLLFEALTKSPYEAAKMEVIKSRLLKLNDRKIAGMFEALREAERIIGYLPPGEKQDFYRTLFSEQMMGR